FVRRNLPEPLIKIKVHDGFPVGYSRRGDQRDRQRIAGNNPPLTQPECTQGNPISHKRCLSPENGVGYEPKLGTAMRRGNWKMIVKEDKVQLFNLKNEPQETTNVADQHSELGSSMKQGIDRFKKEVTPGS
ncbi:MAG: hypothetical protein ACI814_003309, partial [Mariniblastus sp.]